MKKLRWQLLIVILALSAIGLILVGQKPNALPADTVSQPQPETGGVYSEGLIGAFSRLNPVLDFYNPADRDVDSLVYSSLITFDDRGLPVPELAESWGISQDGQVYNFSLRAGALWHDGQPVTTADVLFTIELLRSPGLPIPEDVRALWQDIEVTALNSELLQFHLPEPFSPFLDYLTFGLLPKHLLENLTPQQMIDAPFNLAPVGSGPYKFARFLVESDQVTGVILTANDAYHPRRPFIDQVVFRYYPDAPALFAAYKAGDVMGLSQVPPEILPAALQEPNLNLYAGRLPQLTLIFLNLDNREVPFLADVSVRRALMLALNRQGLIDRLLGGQAILADGPLFPGTWAYFPSNEALGYDPNAAVELLKAAGYTIPASGGSGRAKDGVSLALTLSYPAGEPYASFAEAIQRYWTQIGVDVALEPLSYADLVDERLTPRAYHAALVDLNLTHSPDPDPYPFWHQAQATGGQNYAKWDDRQASEYLEQARIALDLEARARLYRNFQIRFVHELPALPLFYPVYTYAVDTQVLGVQMGPLFSPTDRLAHLPTWFLRAHPGPSAPTATP